MQPFLVFGIFFTLGNDMADRVFPAMNDFDFDEFGVGEQIDEAKFCVGFDFAAELGLEAIADGAFGLVFALDFAPVGEEVEFV